MSEKFKWPGWDRLRDAGPASRFSEKDVATLQPLVTNAITSLEGNTNQTLAPWTLASYKDRIRALPAFTDTFSGNEKFGLGYPIGQALEYVDEKNWPRMLALGGELPRFVAESAQALINAVAEPDQKREWSEMLAVNLWDPQSAIKTRATRDVDLAQVYGDLIRDTAGVLEQGEINDEQPFALAMELVSWQSANEPHRDPDRVSHFLLLRQ
jgi:hypothetical protein